MANLADKSGDAYSNIVEGTGTNSATFSTPGGVALDIESVVATIDNAAGGATTATLTIRDSSGQVIATKRQGDTIPAAGSGTATWALRLADDGGGIKFGVENNGNFLHVNTTADVDFEVANFFAFASGVAAQVDIESDGTLTLVGTTGLETDSGGTWQVGVDRILEQVTSEVSIIVGAGGWTAQTSGPLTLDTSAGTSDVTIRIPAGASLEVQDSGNNQIFRVNENGDLHGKTGKALVFDL